MAVGPWVGDVPAPLPCAAYALQRVHVRIAQSKAVFACPYARMVSCMVCFSQHAENWGLFGKVFMHQQHSTYVPVSHMLCCCVQSLVCLGHAHASPSTFCAWSDCQNKHTLLPLAASVYNECHAAPARCGYSAQAMHAACLPCRGLAHWPLRWPLLLCSNHNCACCCGPHLDCSACFCPFDVCFEPFHCYVLHTSPGCAVQGMTDATTFAQVRFPHTNYLQHLLPILAQTCISGRDGCLTRFHAVQGMWYQQHCCRDVCVVPQQQLAIQVCSDVFSAAPTKSKASSPFGVGLLAVVVTLQHVTWVGSITFVPCFACAGACQHLHVSTVSVWSSKKCQTCRHALYMLCLHNAQAPCAD